MGIVSTGFGLKAILIPLGSEIEVLTTKEDDARMVEVGWEGSTVMLFARDVQERGMPLKSFYAKDPLKAFPADITHF
jgi:hypothetical protein